MQNKTLEVKQLFLSLGQSLGAKLILPPKDTVNHVFHGKSGKQFRNVFGLFWVSVCILDCYGPVLVLQLNGVAIQLS